MDYDTALSICRTSFRTTAHRQLAYALETCLLFAKDVGKETEILTDARILESFDTLRLAISCGWPVPTIR